MTKKWKELSIITGLSTAVTVGEAAWTGLLMWSTSKIPYIGIPIAALLGAVGIGGIYYIGNIGYFACKDWYKKYYAN